MCPAAFDGDFHAASRSAARADLEPRVEEQRREASLPAMSCGWAGKQPWTRAARRQSGYPAQSARQVPALLGTFALLLGTPEAHMMKPAEHASAVRSLRECATTVADKEGRRYWWRVTSTVMPQLPAGCWYLHMGSSAVPRGLMQLVTDPDGQPAGDRAPKSQELLGYSGSGTTGWQVY